MVHAELSKIVGPIASIGRFPVKSAPGQIGSSQIGPSQIGPNSNRPQVKSAPSQISLKMKVISAQKNKNKKINK
jgi:hypothetical protein